MIIDKDNIRGLVLLSQKRINFLDYLSEQEVVRLSEIVYLCLVYGEGLGYILGQNLDSWSPIAKEKIIKEITDSLEYFGYSEIVLNFDAESFLHYFYNFESGDFIK